VEKTNIYAPNLNRVFETFDNKNLQAVGTSDPEDDYLSMLLLVGILMEKDGRYDTGDGWQFMQLSGSRRAKLFKRKLLERGEVAAILAAVGDNGCTPEDIESKMAEHYQRDMVRTFLSWLETLNLLELKSGRYVASNEEEEEDDATDYPSLDETVNIKEDKFSIYEYLRRLNKGDIILSPDFQRHEVWKVEQKSKFIESILMGLPLPPIYLKKNSETQYIVVDGLQRTSTLRDFMAGKLQLTGLEPEGKNVLNNATIDTLDSIREGLKARIEDRQLFIYVMEPSVSMSIVYDVFNRINTGGTQLSRQEIRNCIFQGRSTRLLKAVAESHTFDKSIGNGIQSLRMKDREAVLRCLAFVVLNYELDYDGSMDKFMETAMTKINKMTDDEAQLLEKKALEVFSLTLTVFGDGNFRIPTDYTRGRINIAVMETVFHYFYQNAGLSSIFKTKAKELRAAFDKLIADDNYLATVRWSTGSTSQVKTRFRMAHNAFDKILAI